MADANLELEVDEKFQRTEWRAQRLGWIVWSLVIVAACLGLLGPGWMSDREMSSSDGAVRVRYGRFVHYHHPSQLEFVGDAADLNGDSFELRVDNSLLDAVEILRIEPEPERSEVNDDSVLFTFLRDPKAQEVKVVFHLEYERYGNVNGDVALAGHDPVTLNQFVYP